MEIPIKKLLILYLCFKFFYPRISALSEYDYQPSFKEAYRRLYTALPKEEEITKEGFKLEDYFEIKLPKYKLGPNELRQGLTFLKNKREIKSDPDYKVVTDRSLVDSILRENNYKTRDVSEDSESSNFL
jgi:hypothetical protein